ncbi:hypothetical protein PRUPE_7G078600 [Prunus persica]|uniref:Disease resistance RPP13-like protein 4 n=1 Tax=Prunus persica TaxID=3760 RepID=M5W5L3_PRUPE|nr:disease resistance RPP13-like protein 4 [Prunus persica]XP_020423552.1 disease resistance RPP13-like protein 4 [Prunus persica]XP_020423553.1 disease resistance RPP13-like protein 4 [Prunus persica]XP_020423554.1 disease resistance RPP13-like protein 4 [Prunus persica]XP_020423555.1 disease resistance RPP13-like protein 4 [Prunus persica]XP_020423556.1 disease resistance RPP13-like protein 4 [Prunus persica]XP_020423557.1 disease resistance RPP13-like protein 4 [Prunus persica]ONH95577.1 
MSASTLKSNKNCFGNIRGDIIPTLINHLNKARDSLSDDEKDMATQIKMLCKDLIYIAHALTGLENFEERASDLFEILLKPQHSLHAPTQTPIHESEAKKFLEEKLRVHSKVIMKLKLLIPSPHKLLLNKDNPLVLPDIGKEPDGLPDLHLSKVFKDSPALKEFRVVYNSLSVITKLCLLCFAAIPANEAIKKRVLVHWWVGEGFVNPPVDGEKTVEEIADGIFQELTKKGCIEPVYKKRRSVVHSFKMDHLIRSAVIVIAKEVRFFNFDDKGNPTANFSSHSYRACLVYRVKGSRHLMEKMANKPHDLDQNMANRPHDLDQNMENRPHDLDPKMLQTVFNVNESYPDFSNVDWSKLRNLKVLHLGRWHSRAKHHIEVEDIEFLRELIHLRILSLQGISTIMKLPDSVCKLLSLRILDLGACPNLELLPETIGSLKNLTHLDMSECYLLERMPKGIAFLSELQVLKGFVVGVHDKNVTSCTFHDLSALKKLRKLSIHTSRADFPLEDELIVLQQFGRLRKLTIEWGRLSPQATTQDRGQPDNVAAQPTTTSTQHNAAPQPATPPTITKNHSFSKLPAFRGALRSTATLAPRSAATLNQELNLEKLDLQCYPQKTAPSWLRPGNLKSLKKLYIRGGELRNLGEVQENDKWAVETLRLKFLSELEMDWKEIPVSFPDLIYLEKFRCPRLTFFPCDESGVWLKP